MTSKDENGTISYTYNYDGTLASKSYPDSKTITYDTYNANKKLTAMTDYLGNTTTYTYNSKGLISAVKETYSGTTSAKTTSYSYYADGNLNKVTYPLSSYMTSTYTYDYAGRVSNITNKLTSSTTYSTHDYTYDNSGNITQKTDTVEGTEKITTYLYNSRNQLSEETVDGSYNRYYYDQYGNLTAEIGLGDVYYTYDDNNRLTQVEDMWCRKDTTAGVTVLADWKEVFTYDKNGNMLSSSETESTGYSAGEKTYTYDTWGRLTGYSNTMGETAAYTYYSDGLRASKTIDSDTIKYYYNGDNVINETLNGSDYATNVMGVDGYISRKQDGTLGYLFKDAHGDVLAAYSSTTNKLADYSYNAWGEMQTENETSSFANNPLRYNGQYYDYESGMTYLRARYYSSEYRRFITEDPIRDGSNWYAYAGNNPVMFVDPSGEVSEKIAAEIIKNNATYIKNAAEEFGVNPGILAATIYAEQVLNVHYTESLEDYAQAFLGLDCSVGISQVKISTAIKLEDAGYISKTYSTTHIYISFSIFGKDIYTTTEISRESNVYNKLLDPETNIRYAAAYIAMIQDLWKDYYPEIDGRTAILATLYNVGEYGSHGLNSNPESNPFGDFAKENYYYMRELLELD